MGIIARAIKTASGTINFLAGSKAKASEVNTDLNTIVTAINGNLDNDNIASDAGIVATKLATITEAGKVSGLSFTNLAGIPAGAGAIPSANLPDINLTTDVVGITPIANGGTSQTTAQLAIDALMDASSANAGQIWTSDGTNGSWQDAPVSFTNLYVADASKETLVGQANTERSTTSGTYVKLKEIVTNGGGSLFFSWQIKAGNSQTSNSKVYKNGSAVGVEKTTVSGTYGEVTDTVAGFVSGDLVQLYARCDNSGPSYVKDFKIFATGMTVNTD